ncbi:MAG: dephospho-CoA kinase [Rothia sp. (in: high G+C Gram-positive bacteria)]|uniref:dephospho-CoA kinase n=1 Tax=Rothia sp. (in: high G+C Gram-positive bacteria) TaxID=1885016 RepID=UPI0026FBFF5A|nr:dephospho-CoA kinase [Rothia sp. (in: high G+C Gram-positive bacteria)]
MVQRIGLTGGIGSGKSTVARMLVECGAVLIDADAISRQLMQPGQEVLAETVRAFGEGILTPGGELDRGALAALVFSDPESREKLNAIVHPAVRAEAARQRQAAVKEVGESAVIVEDIPLLAETGQAADFDGVIVVETELQERLRRLVQVRGMSEADARARIKAQASDDQRRAIATWVIDNSGSEERTAAQVREVFANITADSLHE